MWLRLAFRYLSQAAVILGPMITLQWSLLDFLEIGAPTESGYLVELGLWDLRGPRDEVEFKVRLAISMGGLLAVFVYDLLELYLPQRRIEAFRTEFLDHKAPEWERKLKGGEIRVAVFFARRHWFFPLCRFLSWRWSRGFKDFDPDRHLLLTEWQGLAGRALRRREALFVRLEPIDAETLPWWRRRCLCNEFRLTWGQMKRTKDLTAILAVPILAETRRSRNGHPKHKTVGVVTLDTRSPEGASYLEAHRKEWTDYFARLGKLLAKLR